MRKFWKWKVPRARNQAGGDESAERALFLNGAIAEDPWLDDEISPAMFRDELNSGKGNITVWINSPGGDCFAAAQIYNMLRDYKGKVTVKVDSLAASAASVIAMAGDEVLISPTGMFMVHNPSTVAMGNHTDLQKAIEMLDEVKESIINAYQTKTGLSRNKLSQLMEQETWLDSRKAVELGFADGIIERSGFPALVETIEKADGDTPEEEPQEEEETDDRFDGCLFAAHPFELAVTNQLISYAKAHAPVPEQKAPQQIEKQVSAADCYERLKNLKAGF